MEDMHFLTDADIRRLRDLARRVGSGRSSHRPVARRRRNPAGGSGGSDILIGRLVKEVPARSTIEDGVILEIYTGGWYDDQEAEGGGSADEIGAINRGYNSIRASESLPISVWGLLRTETDEQDVVHRYLEIIAPLDMSQLPGTELTPANGKPQGGFKPSGTRQWQADGGPCGPGG